LSLLAIATSIQSVVAADGTNCTASECNYSVPLDKPGFYTVAVTLPAGQKEGLYNLLIDPSVPYAQAPFVTHANGFHGGGLLREGGQTPSWVGFSIAQFEPVNVTVYNHSNATPLDLILTNSSDQTQRLLKFGPILATHAQTYTVPALEPGFYTASVSGQPSLPKTAYSISVGGSSVFGGVDGGWLDSNNVGWAGFYAVQPRTVNLKVQFADAFGALGAGTPNVQVYYRKADGTMEVYWPIADNVVIGSPPVEELGEGPISPAELILQEVSETTFNPISSIVRFKVNGASLSMNRDSLGVFRNNLPVQAETIQLSDTEVKVTSMLVEGKNDLFLVSSDSNGGLIEKEVTLWAGSNFITGRILDENGQPIDGAVIVAKLGDDQNISATAISSSGGNFQFINIPNRTIILEAEASDNRFVSAAIRGDQGVVQLQLKGLNEPHPSNNDNFIDLSKWDIGTATVEMVSDDNTPSVRDTEKKVLNLNTAGLQGPQTISTTFQVKPNTKSVTVRYRFITSEIPGGFFGSEFNDSCSVTIRSKSGSKISQNWSMNQLGIYFFDSSGATAWTELTLPKIDPKGDIVQIDVNVANVADGQYDSAIQVEKVEERKLTITKLELNDIDDAPLNYLSTAAHTYFSGNTRIHGIVTIEGPSTAKLESLVLEVLQSSKVVAIANLAEGARNNLLKTFGETEKIEITKSQLLFELPSSEAEKVNGQNDGTLTLRLKAKATYEDGKSEEAMEYKNAAVKLLVLYTGINRYGERNDSEGGDGWAIPSLKKIANHYVSNGMTWGDFSNMNGGHIAPHKSHKYGVDVDGWFSGYNSRDANVAKKIIEQLNDPFYGKKITVVYATFAEGFAQGLKDENQKDIILSDGRRASNVIVNLGGHDTHFHWKIAPLQ